MQLGAIFNFLNFAQFYSMLFNFIQNFGYYLSFSLILFNFMRT